MAFDFPATPSVGQVFGNYIWDGEKWKLQGGQAIGAVRYDTPQILSAGQQAQARSNIAAPDLSALSYSGMQINGNFDVSQERGFGSPISATGASYFCDGWAAYGDGGVVATAQVVNTGMSPGIICFASINITTAKPSLAASDHLYVFQRIEGYRTQRLCEGTANAQPMTIGFWTAHNRTGVYGGAILGASKSCTFSYTQNAPGIAEFKTVTVPGCPDGTWVISNTTSLSILFTVGAGASFISPANGVWNNTNYYTGPGQVNGMAATSDVFRLGGVVILPGTQAPTAAQSPNIMRPYDQELVTCQRYWELIGTTVHGIVVGPNNASFVGSCVTKRATPTVNSTTTAPVGVQFGTGVTTASGFALTSLRATPIGFSSDSSGWSGLTAGRGFGFTTDYFKLDARL